MEYRTGTFDNLHSTPERPIKEDNSNEWEIDSEWINLSSPSATSIKMKREMKRASFHSVDNLKFYFTPTSKGGRFLIVDQQTLRLRCSSTNGYSIWVCHIPFCTAQCILDAEEKRIIRYQNDHNHELNVNRAMYKNFINALKVAVRENPQVKPEEIYEKEFRRTQDGWERNKKRNNLFEELQLPSFDDVKASMYNTRNAILSAFSLRPTEENKIEESSPSSGPNQYTRSSEGKRKVTPSKGDRALDWEELEETWASTAQNDASLSDFEEWLEEESQANMSSSMNPSQIGGVSVKQHRAKDHHLTSSDNNVDLDFSQDVDSDAWNADNSLEKMPRRKYRKRPASLSVFTCSHCPYKSNRHFNVQRHERLAHSSKKPEFNCKECGTSYSLEYRLKLHIKAVHQGEGHHCHICSRTFETMTGLKSHLITKHKNEDAKTKREIPPELTCKLCGRVFTTKAHLVKHTSTHIMVQPYRCYSCNKPFLDECTWLTHQNNCNEAFTIQCCLCSRIIPSAHELLAHMDGVHGRAEYSCSCGKSFPWKKSLLTHQQKCSLFISDKAPMSSIGS